MSISLKDISYSCNYINDIINSIRSINKTIEGYSSCDNKNELRKRLSEIEDLVGGMEDDMEIVRNVNRDLREYANESEFKVKDLENVISAIKQIVGNRD